MKSILLALWLSFLAVLPLQAQNPFLRVEAEFTTKEKLADGTTRLSIGKVYFDRQLRRMVFAFQFPEPTILITTDSFLYRIQQDSILEKKAIPSMLDFTVLNLCLQGDLPNFGLEATPYTMSEVSKEGEMVLATWSPPKQLKKLKGDVILSQVDKQLYGLVSLDPKGEVIGKQFYRAYETVQGLAFPTEIIAFSYLGEEENKQITTYRNIQLNQLEDDSMYAYPLPE